MLALVHLIPLHYNIHEEEKEEKKTSEKTEESESTRMNYKDELARGKGKRGFEQVNNKN